MGTFLGFLLILFLIFYPPYMLIKWAIFGHGLFFPSFKRMSEKLRNDSAYSNYEPGCWLMFNYYLLLLWTLGEFCLFVYIIYKMSR